MNKAPIFFCAVGGSGMLPLALIMKAHGFDVRGSDRSYDQGRTPERFDFIKQQGIKLFPQDGSGVTPDIGKLIVSTAVEKNVPDYQAALKQSIPIVHRAELLAEVFNQAETSIAIAGTSGKSTTTGIIGWILKQAQQSPTIMNGAVMKNFITKDAPLTSAVIGNPNLFVSEVDESDGSISHFNPTIAVLNNIALDHKSMDELRTLFKDFVGKAQKVVLNLDNEETAKLANEINPGKTLTYSLSNPIATLCASNIQLKANGTDFDVIEKESKSVTHISLQVPGLHNVSNALAALGTALSLNLDLKQAAQHLNTFTGIARRLDVIGTTSNDITVIDDFAHNPDKIAASLKTLHQSTGRLWIMFQPHGFGPLRMMRKELADGFSSGLTSDDRLYITEALYLGGTTDKSITSADLVQDIAAKNIQAHHCPTREQFAKTVINEAKPTDKIVIMGARDDTLSQFAKDIFSKLS